MKNPVKSTAFVLLMLVSVTSQGQHAFTNLAGWPGGSGNADGAGTNARFGSPSGIGKDSVGNVYIADSLTVRRLSAAGTVTTWVGDPMQVGSLDGTGSKAQFNGATGIAVDSNNTVYVADLYNHTVRKVTASGLVTTLAGSAGQAGSANGTGNAARFNLPSGVAVDGLGNVYVADYGNHTVRKVTPAGVVTTLAGRAGQSGSTDGTGDTARFSYPSGVAVDKAGNVYVADSGNHTIRKLTPARVVTTIAGSPGQMGSADGKGNAARFMSPTAVSVDGAGSIYVADLGNQTVRKVSSSGVVTTLAGSPGQGGSADGSGSAARFSEPRDVSVDTAGNIYVADRGNSTVRQVSATGMVTTMAGCAAQAGATDGMGSAARFMEPRGVGVDTAGNAYVADSGNHTIRKVAPNGLVTTLAGSAGQYGSADGTGTSARFFNPSGVAVDDTGNVYVADSNNQTIRKISPAGVVTTLAGSPGQWGTADGPGADARFGQPDDLTVDGAGNVYVADSGNDTIRKITPAGIVTTLAGSPGQAGSTDGQGNEARFREPSGVAADREGNVYVADTGNFTIRKVTPGGLVTTLAGSPGARGSQDGTGNAARFDICFGLGVDGEGNVYVAESMNHTIRKVTPDAVVTTIGGSAGVIGGADGVGSAAQFTSPQSVAADSAGTLYVVDKNRIARGTRSLIMPPHLAVSQLAGGTCEMVLSGVRSGAVVVWESSTNLSDWQPIQTNVSSGSSLGLSRSIHFESGREFMRALVK
ncbi:MAG TPA: NHL repeat-containing protein [Candidatus Limnocylindrales bacterium]|jgi:sugar lactone lactonase YvrE|nr:NHL repeat-containing protein [Candidatus Limnocylindrales bacterium]